MNKSRNVALMAMTLTLFFLQLPVRATERTIYVTDGADGVPVYTDRALGSGSRVLMRTKKLESLKKTRKCDQDFVAGRSKRLLSTGFAIEGLIRDASLTYAIDESLLHALVRVESGYNVHAVSRAGAVGLMQLMPATAIRFGVSERTDARQNVLGGTRYLRYLIDLYGGDLSLALAAYNAGEGAVLKYGMQIPPYAETKAYVQRVLSSTECV